MKKRGVFTLAIVSKARSRLAEEADLSIVLPVEKELCPYNLAPTTSTAAQLIFGDCLAVALMKAKRFSLDEFAANHPAGFIGRKISLTVADLMLKETALPLCRPKDRLIEVLHELSAKRCGCLLVVDERQSLVGIFTDGDLRRALQAQGATVLEMPMVHLVTSSPRTIAPEQLAFEAIQKMEENIASPITVLPVVKNGVLVGLIRMHDILQGIN
jgi:arabinose-5-phosphate isomerase